jgi:U3 small nucleolar RNA-associated protein 18
LPQGTLEATRVRDANAAEPSDAVLRSVAFHANGALFLTAGLDKTVRLFDIDGTNNPKVQGVFFEDLPIHKACFANGGAAVVAAGRRDYFYVYDLARGAVERVAPLVGRPEKSLESFAQSPDVGHHKNDPMLAFLGAGRTRPAGLAQVAHVRGRGEDERLGAVGGVRGGRRALAHRGRGQHDVRLGPS